ncbi:P-loop domain-containing protein, partial [Actinacidiphila paucisporea]
MAGTVTPRSPDGSAGPLSGHAGEEGGGTSFGYVAGNVTVNRYGASAVPRPVRSAYRRQVERIAPPELLGRDAELAELAGFCLDEHRGPYVWWRAGPWAGKSALLSTFVLNPPGRLAAGGVRLVSFFVTARLASQDTREAFTTALTEQLCALLRLDLPAGGDEAAGEAALLDLLASAAEACQSAGGRLVLIVDGLDEDRGVTTGPGAHSIAGLLPGRPPAGMRVIVAGRPNPPVPDDVPDWHPLRDPGIIRLLGDSPRARDLQRLGQSELKRLLTGSPVEQDLLGLLTAARGGLSGPDLRELTGAELVTVEEILHTVAGRTFTRRLAAWAPDGRQQVYLLGHEELHNAAVRYLGQDRLARYRDRLHTWADSYRTPNDGLPPWPAHTPEYLLTGYPRMLATTGDTDRLAALAIDPARHDRMLDLSGGDTAALTEIKTCQDLLLGCPQPDLYALARLSHHRGQLESRNSRIPTGLPAVWATLGQPNRAEALARALTDPDRRAQALSGVAGAVATAGDPERAEQIARTITSPD